MKILTVLKTFGLAIVGGLLGAYGGAEETSKLWRGLGIPILLTLVAVFAIHHWLIFSLMALIGVMSLGYGIPDNFPGGDEGSPLGRFFYQRFIGYPAHRHLLADVFTRGTIGVLSCLALISIPILQGHWVFYLGGSLITTVVYATLSWRTLGSFDFLGKSLTFSEFIPYTVLTGFATFMILRG